jgi:hypothetical protein
VAAVVTVIVELVPVGFGEKLAVAPVGKPLALKVTWPLNPLIRLTVTV